MVRSVMWLGRRRGSVESARTTQMVDAMKVVRKKSIAGKCGRSGGRRVAFDSAAKRDTKAAARVELASAHDEASACWLERV